MPKDATPHPVSPKVRRVLRKEITDFFRIMRTEQPGWPAVPEREFIDALADSLIDAATQADRAPVAYIQTLIHELQDRVNQITKG